MSNYTVRIKNVNYVFQPNDTVFSVTAYLTDTRNNPFLDVDGVNRYITFTFFGSAFPVDPAARLNHLRGVCMEQLRKIFARTIIATVTAGSWIVADLAETISLISGMSVSGKDADGVEYYPANTVISQVRPTSVVVSAANTASTLTELTLQFGVESWVLVWDELNTKFLEVLDVDALLT